MKAKKKAKMADMTNDVVPDNDGIVVFTLFSKNSTRWNYSE